MPYVPKSLQESCMMVVIKHELSREFLPETIMNEVDQLESSITSAFTGKFYTYSKESVGIKFSCWSESSNYKQDNFIVGSGLSVTWINGRKLKLAFKENALGQEETILIKAGVENKLGDLGRKHIMLPGREVSILDFEIDLTRRKLSLLGSCSSPIFKHQSHHFKTLLSFFPDDNNIVSLRIETILNSLSDVRNHGCLTPLLWKRSFFFTEATDPYDSGSEDLWVVNNIC